MTLQINGANLSDTLDAWHEATQTWTDISIFELHGFLTGLLMGVDVPSAKDLMRLFSALGYDALTPKLADFLHDEMQEIADWLDDADEAFEFAPLVLGDNAPMRPRLLSLKDWSAGFITGVGACQLPLDKGATTHLVDLSKIAGILVFDLEEVENAPLSFDDSESTKEDETLAQVFFECYEFARLCPLALLAKHKKNPTQLALIKGLAIH